MRCWLAGLALIAISGVSVAQIPLPVEAPPDGATLFRNQCATCHTLNASEPPRQGPTLAGIIGRRAGSVPQFRYSDGFKTANFAWDEAHLDAWLTTPQGVIDGAIMPYRQDDPEVRKLIIGYLKGQH